MPEDAGEYPKSCESTAWLHILRLGKVEWII